MRIRPIERYGGCKWDEEVFKGDWRLASDELVAEAGPRQVINPQRMGSKQLRRTWRGPVRQPIIVLLGRLNLPAHDQEHDEDYSDLLGGSADVWKGP